MEFGWCGEGFTFLGKEDPPEEAKYIILQIPFDSTTTSLPGAREGPFFVIKASRDLELYDEETGFDLERVKIHTLNPLDVNRGNVEDTLQRVKDTVEEIKKHNKIPVMIGGEHSPSIGALSAFDDEVLFVCFDAHGDLRDEYEGSKYSNACVCRRISENKKTLILGVRSLSREEFESSKENKNVTLVLMKDTESFIKEKLANFVKGKKVYISIDLDVLDVKGVGTPEPGGMNYNSLLKALKTIIQNSQLVGFDVMECNPMLDPNYTPYLAAKLIKKIISYNEL